MDKKRVAAASINSQLCQDLTETSVPPAAPGLCQGGQSVCRSPGSSRGGLDSTNPKLRRAESICMHTVESWGKHQACHFAM